MLKNKTVIFLVLLFILSSVFYFILSGKVGEDTQNKNNIEYVEKKFDDNHKCFYKEVDDVKRIIMINKVNDHTDSLEVTGGDLFLRGVNIENNYIFNGFEKDSFVNTFGELDGYSQERLYKIVKGGIIEGVIDETNLNKIIGKNSKALRIKDSSEVKFDDKFLIPEISCDDLK